MFDQRVFMFVQKARLARLQQAKLSARRNLVDAKRRAENQLQQSSMDDSNIRVIDKKDVFELQHLHLLSCLETTTVSVSYTLTDPQSAFICCGISYDNFRQSRFVNDSGRSFTAESHHLHHLFAHIVHWDLSQIGLRHVLDTFVYGRKLLKPV